VREPGDERGLSGESYQNGGSKWSEKGIQRHYQCGDPLFSVWPILWIHWILWAIECYEVVVDHGEFGYIVLFIQLVPLNLGVRYIFVKLITDFGES
jgi:hypothetical protein